MTQTETASIWFCVSGMADVRAPNPDVPDRVHIRMYEDGLMSDSGVTSSMPTSNRIEEGVLQIEGRRPNPDGQTDARSGQREGELNSTKMINRRESRPRSSHLTHDAVFRRTPSRKTNSGHHRQMSLVERSRCNELRDAATSVKRRTGEPTNAAWR